MYLEVGVVLLAAAVLVFAWGYAQHRRAVPARWTRSGFLSSGFTLIVVAVAPAAAGSLAMAAFDPATVLATLDPIGIAAMVAAVALTLWAMPRLIREGKSGGGHVIRFPAAPGTSPQTPRKRAA